jgi:predicted ATPase
LNLEEKNVDHTVLISRLVRSGQACGTKVFQSVKYLSWVYHFSLPWRDLMVLPNLAGHEYFKQKEQLAQTQLQSYQR